MSQKHDDFGFSFLTVKPNIIEDQEKLIKDLKSITEFSHFLTVKPNIIEDQEKLIKDLKSKAENGSDNDKLAYADALSDDAFIPDFDEAFPIYEELAKKGVVKALKALGDCYYYGHGIEADKDEAFKYYNQAAKDNLPQAKYSLAHCFNKGIGTQENPEMSFYWMVQAAIDGIAEAQYQAGIFCSKGYGTNVDDELAKSFYLMASNNPKGSHRYAWQECQRMGYNPVNGRRINSQQDNYGIESRMMTDERRRTYAFAFQKIIEKNPLKLASQHNHPIE